MGTYSASSVSPSSIGFGELTGYQSVMNFRPSASGLQKACLPVTDIGHIYLASWNSWPSTNQDYDLFLYDSSMTNLWDGSADVQDGIGLDNPIEIILPSGPFSPTSACVVIASWSSSQNHLFHIDVEFNEVQSPYRVRAGSLDTPADATGALAVGAIHQATDILEPFSSSGPSDDGRNKPEICGPDNTFSHQSVLNPFPGTSAATPHVAGMASLLLQNNTSLSPDQLKNELINNARFNSNYSVNNLCGSNSGALFLPHLDSDNDGVRNSLDNCPLTSNPDQADLDFDQIGDLCDGDFDGDGDTIPYLTDNCPLISNIDQADFNNDGEGDACDDYDSDGFFDSVDNCIKISNANQIDLDSDGYGNFCDVFPLDPNNDMINATQIITEGQGGFNGTIPSPERIGKDVTNLGDLDGDGIEDIFTAGNHFGGYVLILNQNGTVKTQQKISLTEGNFSGSTPFADVTVEGIGDLDGDLIPDLAIDDFGGNSTGAVSILSLNHNGTVKSQQKISDTEGNFTGSLEVGDFFGWSIASIGDLDGDLVSDLAVGAIRDVEDDLNQKGSVWILFLNDDGTVKTSQKISETQGNFTGELNWMDEFGYSISGIGDLDGDGVKDIAVGAMRDDDEGTDKGAVWILFLNADGTVKSHQKISSTFGNFDGILENNNRFGRSVAEIGDIDLDGTTDLLVGGLGNYMWLLFLEDDGTVKAHQRLGSSEGGLDVFPNGGTLDPYVSGLSDLDENNSKDFVVSGNHLVNSENVGAAWIVFTEIIDVDFDDDFIEDRLDTCITISNPSQTDTDGDGLGDACNDGDDSDGDEYSNSLDNCPNVSNPNQKDTDSDGTGDACDLTPFPICSPPQSGDWMISSSCTLDNSFTSPASVMVQNNAVLHIPNTVTLTIPSGENITIKFGGGVWIKNGGALKVLS
jgi:hypothetical protein